MDKPTRAFEEHRRLLEGIAYRMLGTLADAQDVVQDAWLKWSRANHDEIRDPRAWLVTACSRLALDVLKSARVRRENYYGVWLPEPFPGPSIPSAADRATVDETVSVALLLALEKLSPAERAAFLLHEVFDYSFAEVGRILAKSPAACRKLASRARASVQSEKPRFAATPDEHQRLLEAFLKAAYAGELDQLKCLFAESVELHSDGGGKVEAAARILNGAETVAQFMVGVLHHRPSAHDTAQIVFRWFNGVPGVLIYESQHLATAMTIAIRDGVIHRIYAVRNPDKLAVFSDRTKGAKPSGP